MASLIHMGWAVVFSASGVLLVVLVVSVSVVAMDATNYYWSMKTSKPGPCGLYVALLGKREVFIFSEVGNTRGGLCFR